MNRRPLPPFSPLCRRKKCGTIWTKIPFTRGRLLMPNPVRQDTRDSFIEYTLMLILIVIVVLAIFLIMGDDIRTFVNAILRNWASAP